jgi:hypothetical protein
MSRANDSSALGTGSTALCGLVFAMNDIVQSAESMPFDPELQNREKRAAKAKASTFVAPSLP